MVEDDRDLAFALERLLSRAGYNVEVAGDASSARHARARFGFDAVLLDLGLPDTDGLELLSTFVAEDASCPVVVLTGLDDAAHAVQALRRGAADYLTKPAPNEAVLHAMESSLERSSLARRLEAKGRCVPGAETLVGDSPAWLRAATALSAAALSQKTSVLLTGESGTGKELAANLIHRQSGRASGPFVTVNASCFTAALLDSELFGHEAGAFTDARTLRRGLFELAGGGTLFLDEVGEMPLELQPKLLRVLEGHPFRRIGGERELRTDVRIVSATNRTLAKEVEKGRFRADLFQRLRVLEIELPPLRERGDDVLNLAAHFFRRISSEMGFHSVRVAPATFERLASYPWPGNVRELRNVIERALVLARGREVTPCHLPAEVSRDGEGGHVLPFSGARSQTASLPLEEVVRRHVLETFRAAGGNVTRAAQSLGISRVALRRHLEKYGEQRHRTDGPRPRSAARN